MGVSAGVESYGVTSYGGSRAGWGRRGRLVPDGVGLNRLSALGTALVELGGSAASAEECSPPWTFAATHVTAGVASIAQLRKIQLRSVKATLEGAMDIQGILGIDGDVRNGFNDIKVSFDIDADASKDDIEALVAQSQKRSAVYDIVTNPTNVTVVVN